MTLDQDKKTEYSAASYPPRLNEDEFISVLEFYHSINRSGYIMRFCADYLDIEPKPPFRILKGYIRALKRALTKSHEIFLLSAREKLNSAVTDFLQGQYRCVAHNTYYALFHIVQSLAAQSGRNTRIKHGDVQEVLSGILLDIASGNHKIFDRSRFWKRYRSYQLVDPERYSEIAKDLYEIREKADYKPAYEIGEFVHNMSDLLPKTEELLNISEYMASSPIFYLNGKLARILPLGRELQSCPKEVVDIDRLERGVSHLVQGGLIFAEGFESKRFLMKLISRNDTYCVGRSLSLVGRFYVKYERCGKHAGISLTSSKIYALMNGCTKINRKTVKSWSKTIKHQEINILRRQQQFEPMDIVFSDGMYFFEIKILADGRFYVFSELSEKEANGQIDTVFRLRNVILETTKAIWGNCAAVVFQSISILAASNSTIKRAL